MGDVKRSYVFKSLKIASTNFSYDYFINLFLQINRWIPDVKGKDIYTGKELLILKDSHFKKRKWKYFEKFISPAYFLVKTTSI